MSVSNKESTTCYSSSSNSSVKSSSRVLPASFTKPTITSANKSSVPSTRSRSTSSKSSIASEPKSNVSSADNFISSRSAESSPKKKGFNSNKIISVPVGRRPLGELDQTEKSEGFLKPKVPIPRSTPRSVKTGAISTIPNKIKKSASAQNISKLGVKNKSVNESAQQNTIDSTVSPLITSSTTPNTITTTSTAASGGAGAGNGNKINYSVNKKDSVSLGKARSFTATLPLSPVLDDKTTLLIRDDFNIPPTSTVVVSTVGGGDIVTATPVHHVDYPATTHTPAVNLSASTNYSVNIDLVSRMEKEKKIYEQRVSDLNNLLENKIKELDRSNQRCRNLERNFKFTQEFCSRLSIYYEKMFLSIPTNISSSLSSSTNSSTNTASTIVNLPSIEELKNELLKENQENLNQLNDKIAIASLKGDHHRFEQDGGVIGFVDDQDEDARTTGSFGGIVSMCGTTDTKDFVIKRWQMLLPNDYDNCPTLTTTTTANATCSHAQQINNDYLFYSTGEDRSAEVSVADLQDKLLQLEENQYSTNEELQATLQELCDLQKENDDLKLLQQETMNEQSVLYEAIQMQKDREKRLRETMSIMRRLLTSASSRPLLTGKVEENQDNNTTPTTTTAEDKNKMIDLLNLCDTLEEDKQFYMHVNDDLAASYEDMLMENSSLRDRCETLGQQMVQEKQQYHELYTQHISLQKRLEEINKEKTILDEQIDLMKKSFNDEKIKLNETINKIDKEKKELHQIYTTTVANYNELQKEHEQCHNMHLEKEKVQKLEEQWRETQGRQQNEVHSLREQCKSLECERHRIERHSGQLQGKISSLEEKVKNSQAKEMEMEKKLEELKKQFDNKIENEKQLQSDWKAYEKDLLTVVCFAEDARVEAVNLSNQLQEKIKSLEVQLSQLNIPQSCSSADIVSTTISMSVGVQASNNTSVILPAGNSAASRLSTARIMAATQLRSPDVTGSGATSIRNKKSTLGNTTDKCVPANYTKPGLVKAKVASFEAVRQSQNNSPNTNTTKTTSPDSNSTTATTTASTTPTNSNATLKKNSGNLYRSFTLASSSSAVSSDDILKPSESFPADNDHVIKSSSSRANSHSPISSPLKEVSPVSQLTSASSAIVSSSDDSVPTSSSQTFPRRYIPSDVNSSSSSVPVVRNSYANSTGSLKLPLDDSKTSQTTTGRVGVDSSSLNSIVNNGKPIPVSAGSSPTASMIKVNSSHKDDCLSSPVTRHSSVKFNSDSRSKYNGSGSSEHTSTSRSHYSQLRHYTPSYSTTTSTAGGGGGNENNTVSVISNVSIANNANNIVKKSESDYKNHYNSNSNIITSSSTSNSGTLTTVNRCFNQSVPSGAAALHQSPEHLTQLRNRLGSSSMRNALLTWCQSKLSNYSGVELTNFSSSWSDGLALCGLLHNYLPELIDYQQLYTQTKSASSACKLGVMSPRRRCFEVAFRVAESVGLDTMMSIDEMMAIETPTWRSIMNLVTLIYMHFEVYHATDSLNKTTIVT